MARKKRKSPAVEKAVTRAASLSSISPTLDLGNGLTLAAYEAAIANITDAKAGLLTTYNTTLSTLDGQLSELQKAERALNTLSAAMLRAAGIKYGEDSKEYEEAGGVRTSARKRPARKATAAKTA